MGTERSFEVSSLTTCDELREASSEIKRVARKSRGSGRSNYLHKPCARARGPTVTSTSFFSPPLLYFPGPGLHPGGLVFFLVLATR